MTGALAWVACVEGLLTEAEHLAEQALTGAESLGMAAHPTMVDAVRTQGASRVRARRSRHGRTAARAVTLDERRRASRLRARQPALAVESCGSPMVEEARHSLALSERVPSCGPTPQVRSSVSVTRWKAASRSRSATSTARPDARSASRRETEHPCFTLGSSLPAASSIAPTTPSPCARRRRRASASTSPCFPPGSRTGGDLTPQTLSSQRRSLWRRPRASSWPSPTTSRAPTARRSAPAVTTHRAIRAGRARSPRT